MKIENLKLKIVFIGIFALAAFFRLYGLNWDQGQHLHPDERFLTMVANGISWPKDFGEYLDTATSPLNPHNRGFGFFVYGTFPVFFTKWVAESLGQGDYGNLTLIGRELSAFADLGTVLLVFLIGKQLITNKPINTNKYQSTNKLKNEKIGLLGYWKLDNWMIPLWGMFLYSIMVLSIQMSHFFTVDIYLTFFITLSFYFLIKLINCKFIGNWKLEIGNYAILLGIAFGLALASKISAVLFLPIIGLGFLIILIKHKNLPIFLVSGFLFLVSCFIVFRIAQPYAFTNSNILDISLNQKVLDNWKQLEGFMKPDSGFPPSVQWFGINPFLFPLASTVLWGLGLPLGIIAFLAVIYHLLLTTYHLYKKKISLGLILNLSLLWILLLFTYEGLQPAPTIRYFHVIYPFLAITTGYFIVTVFNKLRFGLPVLLAGLLFFLIWPVSFIQIYSRAHSRISASAWIYSHLPPGATIAVEHWDDGLPMTLDSRRINQLYKYVSLPLYDPDKPEKWPKIAKLLDESDYIALTSNRLWGSITKASKLFPQTSRYYHLLFDGSLGFEKIAEITSFPSLPIPFGDTCVYLVPPGEEKLKLATGKQGIVRLDRCDLYDGITYQGIVIRDEISEETFTVYDHPKVIIFKKVKPLDYVSLLDDHNYKQ